MSVFDDKSRENDKSCGGDTSSQNQFCQTQEISFENKIFQSVAYVTHKCPILQSIFVKWSTLSATQKSLLNYLMYQNIISNTDLNLYVPLIKGLYYWENVQETEGACGYHENPLTFKFSSRDEQRICNMILLLDKVVNLYVKRQQLNWEIEHFKKD